MKKTLLAALSLAFFQYSEAQPYLTNMGGTYVKVTDYTQVKDKDIVIFASHSTQNDKDEVRIMTTASLDLQGRFGFYTYENNEVDNGMPASITLSEVNKENYPYEYVVNWTKTQSAAQYLSLQDINGKYIEETKGSNNSMCLSEKENKNSAVRNGNISGYVIFDTGEKMLLCLNNANQNGYFTNLGGRQNYTNDVDIYRKVHEVSLSEDGFATFYYGSNDVILPAGMKAYTYQLDGEKLTYSHEFDGDRGDVVPHSTGVILKGSPNTTYTMDVKNTQTDNSYENVLRGTDDNVSTKSDGDADNSKYYAFCNGDKGLGFYFANDNGAAFVNTAHKAYLCLEDEVASKGFTMSLPGYTPTDVRICESVSETLRSNTSNEWHDLTGRRVSKPMKGMYIRDGKIVAVQ